MNNLESQSLVNQRHIVSLYDNLPQVVSNKARTAKTKEQQDALKRIAERINCTLLCINGACSNVR